MPTQAASSLGSHDPLTPRLYEACKALVASWKTDGAMAFEDTPGTWSHAEVGACCVRVTAFTLCVRVRAFTLCVRACV
jgi:hypothetical protein